MPAKAKNNDKTRIDTTEIDDQNISVVDSDLDKFEILKQNLDSDDVRVILRRLQPEMIDDVEIKGYLEDMPIAEVERFESYIKNKYGGGKYQIEQRVEGRYRFRGELDIAGRPLMPAIKNDEPPHSASLGETDYKGVNIGGTWKEFEDRFLRLKAIERMFQEEKPPVPADINSVLLTHILSQSKPQDISTQLQNLSMINEIATTLSPNGGGGGGDISILSLLQEAVKAVGKIAQNRSQPPPRPAPGIVQANMRELSGETVDGIRKIPGENEASSKLITERNEEGSESMSTKDPRQIANVAVSNMVASYIADPETTPAQMAMILDNVIDIDDDIKNKLIDFKGLLLSLAKQQLAEHIADDPSIKADFEQFFNNCFDEFINPEREVKKL